MSEWISVKEKFPDPSTSMDAKFVWAYFRHIFPGSKWEQGLCRWIGEANMWLSTNSPSEVEVSHWMPLPAPPGGEE